MTGDITSEDLGGLIRQNQCGQAAVFVLMSDRLPKSSRLGKSLPVRPLFFFQNDITKKTRIFAPDITPNKR